MRPRAQVILWLAFAALVGLCVFATGCRGKAGALPPKPKDTPTLIYGVATDVQQAKAHNAEATRTVGQMDPANVEQLKPVAMQQMAETDKDLGRALEGTKDAGTASVKDAKRITSLLAEVEGYKDATRRWLTRIGIGLVVLGIGICIFGFKGGWIWHGLGCIGWGVGCTTVGRWMPTIEKGVLALAGLVAVGLLTYAVVYWYRNRRNRAERAEVEAGAEVVVGGIVQGVGAAFDAIGPEATKLAKAAMDKVQAPLGIKPVVDRFQGKRPSMGQARRVGDLLATKLAKRMQAAGVLPAH